MASRLFHAIVLVGAAACNRAPLSTESDLAARDLAVADLASTDQACRCPAECDRPASECTIADHYCSDTCQCFPCFI